MNSNGYLKNRQSQVPMTPNISIERTVCKLRLHPSAHFNR